MTPQTRLANKIGGAIAPPSSDESMARIAKGLGEIYKYMAELERKIDRLQTIVDGIDNKTVQQIEWSADKKPKCPKHGVFMDKREKQGDVWYSHLVDDGKGGKCYCKGRPGKDSPGWEL